MEPPEEESGDSGSESTFSSDYMKNYMGFNHMGGMHANPLFLNRVHCDDPEVAAKINSMNLGNSDHFKSRKPQSKREYKSPKDRNSDQLLDKLNSFDFENAINKKFKSKHQETIKEPVSPSSEHYNNEKVDLKNVNLFNMPPSMNIPESEDSDEEEDDPVYKHFVKEPGYKFQRARDLFTNMPLTVIPREEWGALPPKRPPRPPKYPLNYVVTTFKTETSPCFSREECMQRMRELQKYYMEKQNLSDIPFNFMVGHDGTIYEGRGWQAESSRSLEYFPELTGKRLDVAYFGDYRRIVYPVESNIAIIDLVASGAKKGWINHFCDFEDYREGHPQDI